MVTSDRPLSPTDLARAAQVEARRLRAECVLTVDFERDLDER